VLLIHYVGHQLCVHLMRLHESVPELLGDRVAPSLVISDGCWSLLGDHATLPSWERGFLLHNELREGQVRWKHDLIMMAPIFGLLLYLPM
jgi:hypothetical protein